MGSEWGGCLTVVCLREPAGAVGQCLRDRGGLTPAPSPHLPRHGWGRPHGAPLQHLRSLPCPLLPLRRARFALPGEAEVSAGGTGKGCGMPAELSPLGMVGRGAGAGTGHSSVPCSHLCGPGRQGAQPSQGGHWGATTPLELPLLCHLPSRGHSPAQWLPVLIAAGAGAAQLPAGSDSKVNKRQLWGL